jgi:hypothetical protein
MKAKACAVVLLGLCVFAYAEARDASKFEASVGGSIGWLLSGGQKDLITDTVSPEPDSFMVMGLNLQASYFPLDFLGVEVGANLPNGISASSDEVDEALEVYSFSNYYLGLAYRY